MIFVDTNYFLRFLIAKQETTNFSSESFIQDSKAQYLIAEQLFLKAAQDKISLVSSTVVFFEVNFVLKSIYGKDRLKLSEVLFKMLNLKVDLENKEMLFKALEHFQQSNLSLEDCYNLIFAKQINAKDFKTFDEKLMKKFHEELIFDTS